jgi:hypothetical protein
MLQVEGLVRTELRYEPPKSSSELGYRCFRNFGRVTQWHYGDRRDETPMQNRFFYGRIGFVTERI